MEESKAPSSMQQQQMAQQQQQQVQQHQQHVQQQQQQLLLFQQLQRQKQQQQQDAISRFPSSIDVHLRPQSFLHRPINPQSQTPNPSKTSLTSSSSNPRPPQINNNLGSNYNNNSNPSNPSNSNQQQQQQQEQQQQQQQQQKVARANPAELQLAYQDAWKVCHPDFKRPFSTLEDACERLLPYHVVADYEAEEDDKILDSDTTGQMLSRSQQWDNNIAAKVAEFTATFEKQVLAFNIISRKRALGEFRTEEKLMLEQLMLQEEKRALFELRSEMDSRQKIGRENHEANLRMAAARAEQTRGESRVHREMVGTPIRANEFGSQVSHAQQGQEMIEHGQEANNEQTNNGWGSNPQRDEKEPSEDFLNDDETENEDAGNQSEWRAGGELDLNTR
ncbi:hypothetical protein LIER_38060 [Lithospermum erythrorhizon]|uniref:GLTSCR protein conserved domain-containing protein n=1 Tax=Lithospermum erythrorhizon TaxID=34254 RepID=A0AAV3PZA9_LITER